MVSQYISIGYVDAAGGENWIYVSGEYDYRNMGSMIVISGPAKISLKKQVAVPSLITLEIVDQNTPKSGVTFMDN